MFEFFTYQDIDGAPIFVAQDIDNDIIIYSNYINEFFRYKKITTLEKFKFVIENWRAFAIEPQRYYSFAHVVELYL